MRDDYKNKIVSKIAGRYQDLEERIMQDIVRRIVKAGEITSTADWQINRLQILGYSSEDIEKGIKDALNASYPEMFELYDKVINWEYVRNKDVYEQINVKYIPFEQNKMFYEWSDEQVDSEVIRNAYQRLENEVKTKLGFEVFNEIDELIMECVLQERLESFRGGFQLATALWKECC